MTLEAGPSPARFFLKSNSVPQHIQNIKLLHDRRKSELYPCIL